MTERIIVNDVGPRDGLQNQARVLTPAQRLQLIRALLDAGLRHIEIGSFVSPKAVPAMAGSDEVAAGPNYFAPTVLIGATTDMLLWQEETFGPVVPVFRFEREDEVVAAANDTPFGLAAYFYTRDIARAWRVGTPFPASRLTDRDGFAGLDGAFRFGRDGIAERALEVKEVRGGTTVTVSPAPKSFR